MKPKKYHDSAEESLLHHSRRKPDSQTHVHEFLGSTKLAELREEPHNHRFAGVTGERIRKDDSHIHEILTKTDFFEDHYHGMKLITGLAIPVGKGRHIHFVYGTTTVDDGHDHDFVFATMIESPSS